MNGTLVIMKDYWGQRHQIPKGVWLLLFSYSLVAFGSPMPAKITWLEIVMGCGLLLAGIALAGEVLKCAQQQITAKWCLILTVALFLIPLYVGLARGNALSNVARDIFPLAFLLLIPIFLRYSVTPSNRKVMRTLVSITIVFVGTCTAVIFFVGTIHLAGSTQEMSRWVRSGFGGLEIQAAQAAQAAQATQATLEGTLDKINTTRAFMLKLYDPAMLFAAIYFSAWGVMLMVSSWSRWAPGIFLFSMGALIAYGFLIIGLRAYIGLFALTISAVISSQFRSRGFYLRLFPFLLIALILLLPQIEGNLQILWIKQQIVGADGKLAEWRAVISTISASTQTALWGIGFGGVLDNPILLGIPTRFTHSMLSYFLLKSGIVGLITLILAIAILLFGGKRGRCAEPLTTSLSIILLSCVPPLIIGVLFEPTYKMLSYGVILALFVVALPAFEKNTSMS